MTRKGRKQTKFHGGNLKRNKKKNFTQQENALECHKILKKY